MVRKGFSRTQRRRRQRERQVRASFKVNNSTTVEQHGTVTRLTTLEFGTPAGISNMTRTPDLEEWRVVRTDLRGMILSDVLPDLC